MIDEETGRGPRPQAPLPWLLAIALATFSAGLLISPWFETNVRTHLPVFLQRSDDGAVSAQLEQQSNALVALQTRVASLETRPVAITAGEQPALNDPATAPGASMDASAALEGRIAAVEREESQHTTRLDNLSAEIASLNTRLGTLGSDAAESTAAAAKSAEKARGVLLVTAARRAAEQGQSLAVLEPALRRYFGSDNVQAVDHLLASSREVATLDGLRTQFDRLRPALLGGGQPRGGGLWDRFVAGIDDIVSIRRASGDANARRVAEMSLRLKRGDVAAALVILRRLPAEVQRAAREWRLDAEAYANVVDALRQLEAAVLLEDEDLPLSAPDETTVRPGSTL